MVYEEEDFQPMQYGYHLNPDVSEQRIIGMLREVEEELHRKMRANYSPVYYFLLLDFFYLKFLECSSSSFCQNQICEGFLPSTYFNET